MNLSHYIIKMFIVLPMLRQLNHSLVLLTEGAGATLKAADGRSFSGGRDKPMMTLSKGKA